MPWPGTAIGTATTSAVSAAVLRHAEPCNDTTRPASHAPRGHGDEGFLTALARAVAFSLWRAGDVRSILAAGMPEPRPASEALVLPVVGVRSLADYAIDASNTSGPR